MAETDYTYTVSDSDSDTGAADTDTLTFTITVTANTSRRCLRSTSVTRTVAENTASGTALGAAVTATDADSDTLSYTLGGADAGLFAIDSSSGQITVNGTLDFEADEERVVTVTAADGRNGTAQATVTISVTNVDEAGAVSFSSTAPQVGTALTASVSDPDGGETSITWQWASSSTSDGTFATISGATDAAYTPVSDDAGDFLQATASYTDDEGSGKSASAVTANAVAAAGDKVPSFGNATVDNLIYVVGVGFAPLPLPEATGGDGDLTYGVEPDLPLGLAVVKRELEGKSVRELTGTPGASQAAATYAWTVTDSDETNPDSDAVSFAIEIAPDKPANLTATAGDATVALAWDAAGDIGIGGWQVRQRTDGETNWGAWSNISGSSATTTGHTVSDLTNGTTYNFQIRAFTGVGTVVYGAESDSDSATPISIDTAPLAPTDLAASGGDGEVTLSWTAGGDGGSAITGHEYLRREGTADYGDDWTGIETSAPGEANATSFTVTGLTNGTAYSFKVRAVNSAGEGAESNEASATPSAGNRAPAFDAETATRSIAENTATEQNIGEAVTATDADGDILTYSLGGTDVASFGIVAASGQLQTKAALNFETGSSYEVTVTATDTSSETDSITVTISVTNVDEAGAVSFSSTAPQVGTKLTAMLSDPDGRETNITWQWASARRAPAPSPISAGRRAPSTRRCRATWATICRRRPPMMMRC